MRNILYYPIGLSDIELIGKVRSPKFREDTEVVLSSIRENPEELHDAAIVQFPVLNAMAAFLKKRNIRLHKLTFFATDQPEHVELREKDTIHAAELLSRFARDLDILDDPDGIETRLIDDKPHDYDAMFKYFADMVRGMDSRSDTLHIINASTGTPAMSSGLIHAFSHFSGRFEMLYTPQGADIAHTIHAAHGLRLERWKHTIQALVSEYHYSSAATVVRQSGVFQDTSVPILLDGMSHLDNFRFETARQCFNEYQTKGRPLNAEQARQFGKLMNFAMQTASDDKKGLTSGELLQLLAAVINTRYSTGRVTEALALLSRFAEALLIHVLNRECGVATPTKPSENQDFIQGLKNDGPMWASLRSGYNAQLFKPMPKVPNKGIYKAVVEYHRDTAAPVLRERIQSALDISAQLDGTAMRDARNHGPYAHGFTGDKGDLPLSNKIDAVAAFLPSYLGVPAYDPFASANPILFALIANME